MNVVADPLGDHLAAINPLCPETYSGKGGGGHRLRLVWSPVPAVDLVRALVTTGPRLDLLAFKQVVDGRRGAHVVLVPFGLPAGYAGVEDGVRHGEEHLDLGVVVVPRGDELGRKGPVSGRLRQRTVRPVLGYHLPFVGELGAVTEDFLLGLLAVPAGRVAPTRIGTAKLRSRRQREGSDKAPVGSYALLDHEAPVPV